MARRGRRRETVSHRQDYRPARVSSPPPVGLRCDQCLLQAALEGSQCSPPARRGRCPTSSVGFRAFDVGPGRCPAGRHRRSRAALSKTGSARSAAVGLRCHQSSFARQSPTARLAATDCARACSAPESVHRASRSACGHAGEAPTRAGLARHQSRPQLDRTRTTSSSSKTGTRSRAAWARTPGGASTSSRAMRARSDAPARASCCDGEPDIRAVGEKVCRLSASDIGRRVSGRRGSPRGRGEVTDERPRDGSGAAWNDADAIAAQDGGGSRPQGPGGRWWRRALLDVSTSKMRRSAAGREIANAIRPS